MEKSEVARVIETINHVQEHLDDLMEELMRDTVGEVEWDYGDLDPFDEGRVYADSDSYSEFVLVQFRDMREALKLMMVIDTNDAAADVCKSWCKKILEVVTDAETDVRYLCKMHKEK